MKTLRHARIPRVPVLKINIKIIIDFFNHLVFDLDE